MAEVAQKSFQFDSPALGDLEVPSFEVRGAEGPTLALIAGVHGCEYSSIAAVGDVIQALECEELAGRVIAIPVVNPSAFRTRTPFVTPEDGKNLNRCFPGRPDGTYSEALAHHIFGVFSECDYLIDLHGGDLVEALEPFVLFDESAVQDASRTMAKAFGLRYAICAPRSERIEGTTVAAAADAGIPSLVAEAGGQGLLEDTARRALVAGVVNVLRSLGMLPSAPTSQMQTTTIFRRFLWLYSRAEGWWEPAVQVGETVEQSAVLGTVRPFVGHEIERVVAPNPGVVLFMTVAPPVFEDGILIGLGVDGRTLT
jgi:predicted deacylase